MLYMKFTCDLTCDPKIYDRDTLLNLFEDKINTLGKSNYSQMIGAMKTTSHMDNGFFGLSFSKSQPNFFKWVEDCCQTFVKEKLHLKKFKLKMQRFWINSMEKGSGVKTHRHNKGNGLVCVFYLYANKNSGNLVLVNDTSDGPPKLISPNDYENVEKVFIPVETNDLIIHLSNTPHGVTTWEKDDPRLSIVFDYIIEELDNNSTI